MELGASWWFLLLRFFACCLAFSFEWYLGIPSLMLYSVFGCWTLQGLFNVVSGLCWALLVFPGIYLLFLAFPGLSQPFLAFAGLCWVLTRVIIAGGERSERAKRASEALWCFLWVSLAYPCFRWRTLAFSCFLLLRFFARCLAIALNGTLAFPHSFSILFLAAPCLLLFSLALPCANIS